MELLKPIRQFFGSLSSDPVCDRKRCAAYLGCTILGVVFAFVMGCETTEDSQIASAKNCLDTALPGTGADRCLEMVGNVSGAQASAVRCSAKYLQRRVTESTFVRAFSSLNNSYTPTNGSPVLQMMSYVSFTGNNGSTSASAATDAQYVFDQCSGSGSVGMTLLASATKIGTDISSLASAAGSTDPADLRSALQADLAGSTATQSKLGAVAIVAYSSYCGGSSSGGSICSTLAAAIATGGGNPQSIGAALGSLLAPTPTP